MAAARLARSASKRWVNDEEVPQCPLCSNRFDGGFLDITAMGRTHCRYCGGVFCTNCCSKELYMPEDEVREVVLGLGLASLTSEGKERVLA